MYTSVVLLALTGLTPTAESPRWQTDYAAAHRQAAERGKPLVVVIASGPVGWQKLSREGKFDATIEQLFGENYQCCYLDSSTEAGRRLAAAFEMSSGLGIVISDRTGQVQAFWHEGDLANADLARYLRRYADPTRPVSVTETNPSHHPAAGNCPTCTSCPNGRCYR